MIPRLALLVTALTLGGCATTGQGQIVREDWVVVPTDSGKDVLRREDYLKNRPPRGKRPSNMEAIPPPLLNQGPTVSLRVGEVKTFLLVDEPARALTLQGSAVQAFWTRPYFIDRVENGHFVQHKGADLHLKGMAVGEADLEVELVTGDLQKVHVDVRPGRPTVGS